MKQALCCFAICAPMVFHVGGLSTGRQVNTRKTKPEESIPEETNTSKTLGDQLLPSSLSLGLKIPMKKAHASSSLHMALGLAQKQVMKEPSEADTVLVRPNAGNGPDIAKVGLMIMNFYGADLDDHTFSIDMVMSTEWNDTRVTRLIPEGREKLSMAWGQAVQLLWMPGVVVTNRDIEKYEIVSASVTINRDGQVLRVERAQARIMMKYALEEYPFDTQDLALKVSSSKYMQDELQLTPDIVNSGTRDSEWGLYNLEGEHMKAYTTVDGVLKKSRAALVVTVKRTLGKYYEEHLVPSFICLTISWAVFYFPFANPFITPRLALSILALLTFTNLMVKSSRVLPGSAPFNWNDLFNQQIQTLMFVTIVLNIASEIAFHTFQHEEFARTVNHEAKIALPGMSLLNVGIILSAGKLKWISLDHAVILTKTLVLFFVLGYACYIGRELHLAHAKYKAEKERGGLVAAAAAAGAADADADADCDCDC